MVKSDEKKPRNVSDVDYATADGNRPMREVIRERKAAARKYSRAQLEAAYRARSREIALLATCLCCYPLARAETASEHEDWCPAESMRRSFEAADASKTETNHHATRDTKGNRHGT